MTLHRLARLLAILVLVILTGCRFLPNPESQGELDAGQIYAAAVRQIYHVDHSFGEAPGWAKVYVIGTTEDGLIGGESSGPPQVLAPQTRQAIESSLADQPFEVVWIESMDDAPLDPNGGPVAGGDGIVITLGNIDQQPEGIVQLPFFMLCGGLCGIGKTYILSIVDGRWQVTGSVGPEIMS